MLANAGCMCRMAKTVSKTTGTLHRTHTQTETHTETHTYTQIVVFCKGKHFEALILGPLDFRQQQQQQQQRPQWQHKRNKIKMNCQWQQQRGGAGARAQQQAGKGTATSAHSGPRCILLGVQFFTLLSRCPLNAISINYMQQQCRKGGREGVGNRIGSTARGTADPKTHFPSSNRQ